jgi:uncharacterized protein YkwD
MGNPLCSPIGRVAVASLAVATFFSVTSAQAQVADAAVATNEALTWMNQYRATAGAPALTRYSALDRAALRHANDMATKNFFDHTGSDGSSPPQRAVEAGYCGIGRIGENITVVFSTGKAAVDHWMASTQGHREEMLSKDHTDVGIAVAYRAGSQYGYYWVALFSSGGTACTPTTPTAPTGGTGQNVRSLGGVATAAPRAGYDYSEQDSDGRLFLFVRGGDGAVYYRARGEITSNWDDWKSLAGIGAIKGNVSLTFVNGRLAVFARGGDDALYYTVRQGAGFAPWVNLGGVLTSDPVAVHVGGRARVFVRGTDGGLWYRAQSDTGQWLGWISLGGGINGAPIVTAGSDGQLVILALGLDGLWQRRDPNFQLGVDPAQLWTWIGYNFTGLPDPVAAPGSSASSPVFLWPSGNALHWGYRSQGTGPWVRGAAGSADGSPCSGNIASKIAVAPRPGGGFYVATRRDGGGLCVLTAVLSDDGGLQVSSNASASNVPGSGDISVVADSRDGRPVVFSLNASGGVEERWF